MILITGCPKSATVYISEVLCHLGLDVQHEKLGGDGSSNWMLAPGKNSQPWEGPCFEDFSVVFHQVREPLAVISSCQNISEQALNYIKGYMPIETYSVVENCLAMYCYWNKLAEKISSWRYKIEELEDVFDVFCEKIGHPELADKKKLMEAIPKNINSAKPYNLLTWDELENVNKNLTIKTIELSRKYGYGV